MALDIRTVAVLGAGTMGAAIAAHAANAGLAVDLLDIVPAEAASDRAARDQIVRRGFERMKAARPAALASPSLASRISLGNFEDDFDRVGHADWVIEAIVEQLEPKQELAARIEKVARPEAVVSSNTSGIPLASIAEGRSEEFRRRFLGTHFFNPPRYLKLVELIPTVDTDPGVLEAMRAFVEGVLGKGAVVAKDTPNFIANRLGSFAGMHDMRYAFEHGYSIEEVDALTGPLAGRPKTASFRLADQIGLDVMVGVADNLHRLAPDDESRADLSAPEPLRRMLDAGKLGIKSGGGFYRRGKRGGETVFDVLDLDTLEYRPARDPDLPVVGAARERRDLGERLRFLLEAADEGDRGGVYLRDTLLPALAYAARRVPEIADSLAEVDHAMEWGFGHRAGPFRTFDLLGVRATAGRMERMGLEVAPWVGRFLDSGGEAFYRDGAVYSPLTRAYEPVRTDPDVIELAARKAAGGEVLANGSASLVDLGDGVLCFELHSPASAIDAGVVELGQRALAELASGDWKGLVIANQADNFCVGANLGEVGMAAYQGAYDQLEAASRALQELLMGFRFAAKPVVAAPHGQTLGGGCEICLHADRVVAALETYLGLVETAVGLVPAGGGCKELVRRIVSPAMRVPDAPPLPFVQRVFETIALAKVGGSAVESRELGFLSDDDRVVLNADHLLAAAKREVLELAPGYRPPAREASVFAAGRPTQAALELGVRTLQWGAYASDYDGVVATRLARVLCGGELSAPQWVTEEHLLELERQAFVELSHNRQTMERIQAMLTTRKPLRN